MRYYLFTIGQKYKLRAEWATLGRFRKWYYFFFYFSHAKSQIAKIRRFDLILLGLVLELDVPYHKKFSYKNMPKIQGRRKV